MKRVLLLISFCIILLLAGYIVWSRLTTYQAEKRAWYGLITSDQEAYLGRLKTSDDKVVVLTQVHYFATDPAIPGDIQLYRQLYADPARGDDRVFPVSQLSELTRLDPQAEPALTLDASVE